MSQSLASLRLEAARAGLNPAVMGKHALRAWAKAKARGRLSPDQRRMFADAARRRGVSVEVAAGIVPDDGRRSWWRRVWAWLVAKTRPIG